MIRISVIVLFHLSMASATDWPHVRGPGYDGHSKETGLADSWPATGPPILWTRELGPGYSSFVVAEGKAFTLFQTTAGMFLIALDADTGAEVWKERIDWPWQPGGMYPGPYASPTWSDGKIFYATPTGIVGCNQAMDGRSVWSLNVREKFGGRGTEFGFASTPTVEDGRVYLPVGGKNAAMVALNSANGSTLWASGDDPASYCPAYPITLDGRRLIVGFFQNSLALFDAKSGERLWRERFSNSYDEHAAWPLFDGRHLLIASPFRAGSQLFRFNTTGGQISGKAVWIGKQFSNDVCSSLLHNGSIYGFDIQQAQASVHRPSKGMFKCIEFTTGQLRWETGEVGQSSLLHADGKLILWTETGTLILARTNPERYEELARAKVLGGGGMCWAAPALAGKRLIVRDHQRAVCLYIGPHSELDPARQTFTLTTADDGFDWTRLVPVEPEFANDAPRLGEIALWFGGCLAMIAIAGATAWFLRKWKQTLVFAIMGFALGAAGTTASGTWFGTFVFTWPLSLYVAFRLLLDFGFDRSSSSRRHAILTRIALLGFVALCYGYYRLCMAVGFAMGWGFLGGFPAALPFVMFANRCTARPWRWGCEALGFAVYFWVSGSIPTLKAEWMD